MQYLQSPEGGRSEPGPCSEWWGVLWRQGAVTLTGHVETDWVPEVRNSLSSAFCGGRCSCWALLQTPTTELDTLPSETRLTSCFFFTLEIREVQYYRLINEIKINIGNYCFYSVGVRNMTYLFSNHDYNEFLECPGFTK